MASEEGVPVDLYIYDLTHGLARILSPAIIGQQIESVWHTSVVVFEREFFYGGGGVITCAPGGTALGAPLRVERLGSTFLPFQVFVDYIQGLATTSYTPSAYRLLEHNCNHFSEEVAQFACGGHVPKHIVRQADVLPPALRRAVEALLDGLVPPAAQSVYAEGVRQSRQESPEFRTLNTQIEEVRAQGAQLEKQRSTLAEKLARKERRREKKRHKRAMEATGSGEQVTSDMSEAVEVEAAPREEASHAGPSASYDLPDDHDVPRETPIIFADVDGAQEFEKLSKSLECVELSAEEKQSVDELQQYLVQGEGSWVLGDEFLTFIGRILHSGDISSEVRVCVLRCLAAAALKDDVALLLHQDRRRHCLLAYCQRLDLRPLPEQRAAATMLCNLFSHTSSSEWLLYISEWEAESMTLSNIRVTIKVSVHCSLSEDEELRDVGTALMYNIATKEVKTVLRVLQRLGATSALRSLLPPGAKSKVFDEACVELGMALLQLLQSAPGEEHLFRACSALARLAAHCRDLPALLAVVGPPPDAYRGTSARVDEQIDLIMQRVK